MMKSVLQTQDIKVKNEYKCPTMPSGFGNIVRHFAYSLPLYWLKRVYRSHHVRLYIKICLFCIWVITIATAAFIAYDNAILRKENAAIIQMHHDMKWRNTQSSFNTDSLTNKSTAKNTISAKEQGILGCLYIEK